MTRDTIEIGAVTACQFEIGDAITRRLREKGDGAYASEHETYGIIAEEFDELRDAMRANDPANFREELVDIAVACIIGMASQGTRDQAVSFEDAEKAR
jgi:NTP pyrophosphatase (non-canonical NTP hydrolase)